MMNNIAFIFPGQGSQKEKMLADLAVGHPLLRATFDEASEVLGYDLWELVQTGPQESLNLTEKAQPMLLTADVAIYRMWREAGGVAPAMMAGHSLGEWSALVCAGVLDFKAAVKVVQLRGKYMQEAVPEGEGNMVAIVGLSDEVIIEACREAAGNEVVAAVNFNSPGQVVIAGNVDAVDRACALCKAKGAKKAIPLAVSAPFHSSLLKPAADKLAGHLATVTFNEPAIPVVQNINAQAESDPQLIKQRMIEQIYHPVLWVACMKELASFGIDTFVECGPGKVLSRLVKRIDKSLIPFSTETPADFQSALTALSQRH